MDSTKPNKKRDISSREKADMIIDFADDIKAQNVELLDVKAKTSVTDYMVIATGTSDTHANAIAERVAEKMREEGLRPRRRSLSRNSDGWIVHDYGDVVFHVMLEEKRQFYDLEALWAEVEPDPDLP